MGRRVRLIFTLLALTGPVAASMAPPEPGSDPRLRQGLRAGGDAHLPGRGAGRPRPPDGRGLRGGNEDVARAHRRRAARLPTRGIKGRNDCWKADDPRACTELSYRTRIVELQIKSGQLMAPTPVGYVCTGGEAKPFFATFYRQTDPPSAVITYGNDQVIAFVAPSGSGGGTRRPTWRSGSTRERRRSAGSGPR